MLIPLTEAQGFSFDLRYATANNITGQAIYTRPIALLAPQAHTALLNVVARAALLGLRLKIFDAFRPLEAQWALWHAAEDKRFVSDPRQGGLHPRGVAVDLTLADATSGQDLEMGTDFDDFSDAAHHDALNLPAEVIRNRALLLGLMTLCGWERYPEEWWHYHLPDYTEFSPLSAADAPHGPM